MRVRFTGILLFLAGIGGVLALWHNQLGKTAGLHARYWPGLEAAGSPALEVVDQDLAFETLVHRTASLGRDEFAAEWDGYLIVPRGRYRFSLPGGLAISMTVDRALVADGAMRGGGAPVELARGAHAVRIRTSGGAVPRDFNLKWSQGFDAFAPIPRVLLTPDLRRAPEVRIRQWLAQSRTVVPLIWLVVLGAAVAYGIARIVMRQPLDSLAPVARWQWALLTATALLFIPGAGWGVPDLSTWAPDEVLPNDVLFAVQARFGSGWGTLYPPLHFALLAVVYLPFQLAAVLGLTNLHDLVTAGQMAMTGRAISTVMAIGSIALVFRMTAEEYGGRAATFAAAVVALNLPLTYYSKTVNLDVPYTFWLIVSLLFYARAHRDERADHFYWFTLAGIAAVCTKDQAYGFFVLPAAYFALARFVRLRDTRLAGVPTPAVFWRMTAIAIVAFAVFHNLPFNLRGFMEHLQRMQAYENFGTYPRTLAGLASLTGTAIVQVGQSMSWPLFLAALLGIAAAARARNWTVLVLLLPVVSYHLFFITVARYHYDRFFLGVIAILAVFAGSWLDRWTRAGRPYRTIKLATVGMAFVYALSRCVALDGLMVRDSRYGAEAWLRSEVAPEQRVAGVGVREYLPRPTVAAWSPMGADLRELESIRPDVLVINASFGRRFRPDSTAGLFYQALARGETEYRLAAAFQTAFPWSPLNLERRFRQGGEDGLSNLTKVNPLIQIYVRSTRSAGL